jgi:hypothetical protein
VAVVELALVIVILVMLVLGAVTGGLAYNRKITLTDAARVAARYGTTHAMPTAPFSANCSSGGTPGSQMAQWFVDVACDAISNAQGELDPTTSGRMICVAYSQDGTESMMEWGASNSGAIQSGSCPGATFTPSSTDDEVEVVVQRTADFDIVVWDQTLTLQSQAFGRYEQVQPS